MVCLRRTPLPVIVTIGDNRDNIRVLLYSYYTTITGWGVLLKYVSDDFKHISEQTMVTSNELTLTCGRYRNPSPE